VKQSLVNSQVKSSYYYFDLWDDNDFEANGESEEDEKEQVRDVYEVESKEDNAEGDQDVLEETSDHDNEAEDADVIHDEAEEVQDISVEPCIQDEEEGNDADIEDKYDAIAPELTDEEKDGDIKKIGEQKEIEKNREISVEPRKDGITPEKVHEDVEKHTDEHVNEEKIGSRTVDVVKNEDQYHVKKECLQGEEYSMKKDDENIENYLIREEGILVEEDEESIGVYLSDKDKENFVEQGMEAKGQGRNDEQMFGILEKKIVFKEEREVANRFKEKVKERLNIKELGQLKKHLGIWYDWKQEQGGEMYVEATIPELVEEIIRATENHLGHEVKQYSISGVPGESLIKYEGETVDETEYRSIVGKILYLTSKIMV